MSLLVVLSMLALTVAAFDQNCYYKLVDSTTVVTYGYYTNADGSITKVPVGSTTYYYYDFYCPSGGGGEPYYGGGNYIPLKPHVTLFQIDTSDPVHPTLLADVTSDPNAPATTVTLTVGSKVIQTLPIGWDGTYQFSFPSVGIYNDGTTTFQVRACTATNACGFATASFSRYTNNNLSSSIQLSTLWLEGDEFKYGNYGHVYRQAYTTTAFKYVDEVGGNSERQLRTGYETLSWPSAATAATFNTSVKSWGMFQYNYALSPCTASTMCGQPCATMCKDLGTYGIIMSSTDYVIDVAKADTVQRMQVTGGDSIHLQIP
jgi:hypothetical protein